MKSEIKLTELTSEEMRRVTGGKTSGGGDCDCSGNKQTFGQHDSEGKPPVAVPKKSS